MGMNMAPVRRGRGRKDPSSSGTKSDAQVNDGLPSMSNESAKNPRVAALHIKKEGFQIRVVGKEDGMIKSKGVEWIPNFSNDIDLLSKHLATGAKHVVSGGEESNAKVKIEERVGVVVHDGGGGFVNCRCKVAGKSDWMAITTFYADLNAVKRKNLWKALLEINPGDNVHWLVGDDFNTILSIEERYGGTLCSDHEELGDMAIAFFSKLFTLANSNGYGFDVRRKFPWLRVETLQALSCEVSDKEIKDAIFCMGFLKAPGVDGVHTVLYKKN
ncbi:hypothetical protein V6N12_058472 [Hibiscus sabdariffa]|uniref:Uncharacterized protein n=1 Tax=Hibiscus sabdariffa TaxID=183260 RepID=A0ABR2ES93_9ROSI